MGKSSYEEIAVRIISSNRYMTLATTDTTAAWASAVAYAVDSQVSFYWYSATDARHSTNIAAQPLISAAIFNSTEPSSIVQGVQMLGSAEIVEDGLREVMDMYFQYSFPDPKERAVWDRPTDDFLGDAMQRFYRFSPHEMYTIDEDVTKVDRRAVVDVSRVQELWGKPAG